MDPKNGKNKIIKIQISLFRGLNSCFNKWIIAAIGNTSKAIINPSNKYFEMARDIRNTLKISSY